MCENDLYLDSIAFNSAFFVGKIQGRHFIKVARKQQAF